ncbi:hypothetical protein Bbelb_373260 [Branchiostoma belcheri]|nr:hypothetical protein Bbelb_373260 [Branchiostoma belcheri]
MADIDGKIRLRLAEDVIYDEVGGAGWTYLDIALQVDKYSPKTVLVKTRKCDQKGNIVLEPKARQRTSSYLVPKDPSDAKILDVVSVQTYKKKASWKKIYSYDKSVSVDLNIIAEPFLSFSTGGMQTTKSYVSTTCTGLEHRSVDIEDLRNALSKLSVQTSAEGMRDETSFLVVTDVLVGKDVSIVEAECTKQGGKAEVDANIGGGGATKEKETQDAKHDGKDEHKAKTHGVGIRVGGGAANETAASQERSNTGGIIIAIKLARVHYDEQGNIERAGVLAGGSYDWHYTLGVGNEERKGYYTVTTMVKPIGVQDENFVIKLNLIGQQNSTEVKVPQDVCETGRHQTRESLPTGSKLLPLKGILVSKLRSTDETPVGNAATVAAGVAGAEAGAEAAAGVAAGFAAEAAGVAGAKAGAGVAAGVAAEAAVVISVGAIAGPGMVDTCRRFARGVVWCSGTSLDYETGRPGFVPEPSFRDVVPLGKVLYTTFLTFLNQVVRVEVFFRKVLVTDLEQDQTYECLCSGDKAVTYDQSLWFDCEQWREFAGNSEWNYEIPKSN